ncbi:MAG: hypothetical protein VW577_04030, partial [Pelagibacteraceae bacterium]
LLIQGDNPSSNTQIDSDSTRVGLAIIATGTANGSLTGVQQGDLLFVNADPGSGTGYNTIMARANYGTSTVTFYSPGAYLNSSTSSNTTGAGTISYIHCRLMEDQGSPDGSSYGLQVLNTNGEVAFDSRRFKSNYGGLNITNIIERGDLTTNSYTGTVSNITSTISTDITEYVEILNSVSSQVYDAGAPPSFPSFFYRLSEIFIFDRSDSEIKFLGEEMLYVGGSVDTYSLRSNSFPIITAKEFTT